ncbi:MAG TPA: phage/plasmid primase, P4 family [Ignavibacteriaceae bacterium]
MEQTESIFTREQEGQIAKIQRFMLKTGANEFGFANWRTPEGIEDGLRRLRALGFDRELIKESAKREGLELKEKEDDRFKIFTRQGQAEEFYNLQPYFYDRVGLWWFWNREKRFWELTDEIDILNMIQRSLGVEIINSKARTEILNSLKQEGRKKIPQPIPPTWIQFKNGIVDIEQGNLPIEASPYYFVTNPINWNLGKNDKTPVMDRIFKEWVGQEYVQTLYEIIAYSMLPDYPINRIFCFTGSGMNGKSKFLELLIKFLGKHNCTTTDLDLLLNSRFEITKLHKKLICTMGETNFNELSKTSRLKQLTGGDLIGFEYKGKNPFEDKNYAKIIISTNSLPTTTDKTIGFYRRWFIIDFPNRFTEAKDILKEIPEEEYESLAYKCSLILKELLIKRSFHNEGTVEERMKRYESRSDFLEKFLKDFIEEDLEGFITVSDFNKKFSGWCIENRHRQLSETTIGMKLKSKGWIQERKYFNWMFDGKGGHSRIWVGIKWKN